MVMAPQTGAPLHVARVRDDLVVLDLATGAYDMVVDVFLGSSGRIEAERRTAAVLGKAAWTALVPLADDPCGLARHRLAPAAETPDLRIGWADRADFAGAWMSAATQLWTRPLRALVAGDSTLGASQAATADRAAIFARLLPWAPVPGACLRRAYALRLFLRRGGGDAEWVFGVRTWPFRAHCWLEHSGMVLNDDPDVVRAYTPILRA